MALKMHELARGEAVTQFDWQGQIVHITFNPNAYTAQAEAEWMAIQQHTLGAEVACSFIDRLVLKWDLLGDVEFRLDEKGERIKGSGVLIDSTEQFPCHDMEKLLYVPVEFTSEVVDAIQLEMVVGKTRRRGSADGSDMAEIRRIPS